MCKLLEAETLIGEAGDYARLISLAMADTEGTNDANKQALARAASRIEELTRQAMVLLDEQTRNS